VFADLFQSLYRATGINLTIFYDAYDGAMFLRGLATTVELSVVTLVLSLVIGVVGVWWQSSRFLPLRAAIDGFVVIFRTTPPLVQIYFFYFGLGALLPKTPNAFGILEPMVGGMTWAILSLSLFAGAFNIEIFRSGIEAVPRSMIEAADALGFSKLRIFVYVVLPLAFRICLPSLNNNLVNLVKTTNLAYAIAVPELLYASQQIWNDATNVPEMMTVLLVTYVGLVGILVRTMRWIEARLAIPGGIR